LLQSPVFAHCLTAAVFFLGAMSVGAVSRWLLQRSGLYRRVRRVPCYVDAWAYDVCFQVAVRFDGEWRTHSQRRVPTAKAIGDVHAKLHRLHAVTVAPLRVFASGTIVLGFGGFGLYFKRRLRDYRRGDMARLVLWVYALGLDNVSREVTVIGLAVVLRELYVAIRPLSKQAAQRLGERVLEVSV